MAPRADALAKKFEEASKAVTDVITRMSDADWKKMASGEKWSVGVVAHHIAMGHAGISNLVKSVASGKSVPSMTMAQLDQMNAQHAKEHAQCTKAETLELHKKNAATAAALVRGLSDTDLDRTGGVLIGMPPMSTQQVVEQVLIKHVNEHLGSIRAAVGIK
jgi:DinB family protein